jgi:hypothetical protein
MPLLHRLATLRDDVIFFVYLYQSWKYKVDYNRVNEFGQGGGDEEVTEKLAVEPLKSIADAEDAKDVEVERKKVVEKATGVGKGAKGEVKRRK